MVYIILILILSFWLLSVIDSSKNGQEHVLKAGDRNIILYTAGFVLFLIVIFRPNTMPDYMAYIYDFLHLRKDDELGLEPGDRYLIQAVHFFSINHMAVFSAFAAVSIPIKLFAIKKYSPFVFLSLAVFTSGSLITQEMTAIRCAIAVSFLLWAMYFKINKNLKKFLLFVLLASLFHYSAVLGFPLWFLSNTKCRKWIYAILIPIAYTSVYLNYGISEFLNSINLNSFQAMWDHYRWFDESDYYNVYNMLQIAKCIVFYFILLRIDTIKQYYPGAVFLMKTYCLSLVATIIFYESQSVAIRVGDIFRTCEIILIPCLLFAYGKKHRWAMHFVVLLYCIGLYISYGGFVGW